MMNATLLYKRLAIAGFALFGFAGTLFAATYKFPSGGGDLADLATWQKSYPDMTALPGTGDGIILGSSSTFTMSSDMSVGSFSFNYQKPILDFASSGNHTLKVLNAQHAFAAHNGTIKGGTIDRSRQYFYWFQGSGYETVLTNGCIVTNASSMLVNVWGTSNGKLRLTGGSRLYADSLTLNNGVATSDSGGTLLEVSDGSSIATTADYNHSDVKRAGTTSGSNVLHVCGTGSSVTMAGTYIDGYYNQGNLLWVSDGGSFTAKSVSLGWNYNSAQSDLFSNSNRLVVVDGTLKMTGDGLYARGDGNVIAVTNSVVDFKNKAYSYNGGNASHTTIDIVNSTWKCAKFNVGAQVDLRLSGASTVFESTEKFFGFSDNGAVDAKICFDDSFDWMPSIGYGYYFMQTSTNCQLTVRNKAKFSAWHPTNNDYERIIFCGSAAAKTGTGNVIRALDGGTIYGTSVKLSGPGNTVIVSNGVVQSTSGAILFGANTWATNNTILVQGNNPKLSAATYFYLWNRSTLRLEIPADGYVDGCVPISAKTFDVHAGNSVFQVDVSRFQPENRTELTLMTFEDALTDGQQDFLLSAELPARYSLKVVDDTKLVLTAKGTRKGFMLLFR